MKIDVSHSAGRQHTHVRKQQRDQMRWRGITRGEFPKDRVPCRCGCAPGDRLGGGIKMVRAAKKVLRSCDVERPAMCMCCIRNGERTYGSEDTAIREHRCRSDQNKLRPCHASSHCPEFDHPHRNAGFQHRDCGLMTAAVWT